MTAKRTYHGATFQLLGAEPEKTRAAESVIEKVETHLGLKLPESIRDWYSRHGAIEVLTTHSNGDPLVPIEKFSIIERQSRRLIPFREENQGVCNWAIALDDSEDPPIYVEVDSGGKDWQLLAPTFSDYVFSCVWDYRMIFFNPALVQAQNQPLTESAVKALRRDFRPRVMTQGWPGSTQFRFQSDSGAILIWASENQADWFVASPDPASLESILRNIWEIDHVGDWLYETSQMGKIILDKLKRE